MNDFLKGYIIFCIVLISIIAIFATAFGPPQIINADKEQTRIISSALKNTDKNVTGHITSIIIVDDVFPFCGNRAGGCVVPKSNGNNSFKADIYLPSSKFLNGTCVTFENVLYHEIGHVVYWHNYGFDRAPSVEQYAINYANRFTKDNCKQ